MDLYNGTEYIVFTVCTNVRQHPEEPFTVMFINKKSDTEIRCGGVVFMVLMKE